jgi:DNA-binding Xre family transcriptional regulator
MTSAPAVSWIHQKVGQSDLAAMAGIARENLNRILNDWKRRKLVSRLPPRVHHGSCLDL